MKLDIDINSIISKVIKLFIDLRGFVDFTGALRVIFDTHSFYTMMPMIVNDDT